MLDIIMILSSYNNLSMFVKRHFRTLLPYLTLWKSFNTALAVLEMKLGRKKCLSRPFMYRIDPCSLCNLHCASCNTPKAKTAEKRMMDLADFKTMIDKIKKYALRASLYDMGEPLLNPHIYEMIKYASDRRISTLISTNFNLFKKEDLEKFFESRLTVLEPCLDGFSQEKYAYYRRGGNVETVKNGIRDVMKYKQEHKKKLPILDVQVVLFDHIKEELPLIEKFLKENKVDQITYRQENLGFNAKETTIADKSVTRKGPCFWLYLGMMVRPDGSVYPCCGRDFDRFSYGNLLKENLSEIWNNRYYQFSRKLFSKGPSLKCDGDLAKIPCLACKEFNKKRRILF